MMFLNQNILVFGLGISGIDACKYLLRQKAKVTAIESNPDKCSSPAVQSLIREGLNKVEKVETADFKRFRLMILSPGISLEHPICLEAKNYNIEIIGEAELACRYLKNKIIGITGTNGKTTVTHLVSHTLNYVNQKAVALGNIGKTLTSAFWDADPEDIIVAELSSFQLETMSSKCLETAVLLNITPDHLDRYKSMKEYAAAKWRIQSCVKRQKKFFAQRQAVENYGALIDRENLFPFVQKPMPKTLLEGPVHDVENFFSAFSVCQEFNVNYEQFIQAYETFKKPPHRIEFVRELCGVKFYNDSKGTNLDATLKAVAAVPGKVVLIAGGVHKGASYSLWKDSFTGKVEHICAIGEASKIIENELSDSIGVTCYQSFESAIHSSMDFAVEGGSVLLSPGCSSFDMFKDYVHRGNEFKRIVGALYERRSK